MRTKDQYKKIWYDILRKSKEFPKDLAERFFIEDSIDPLKFKENYDYYVMDRYGDHKPTQSCFHPIRDKPPGYPYWFAAAYPDVVKYFSYGYHRPLPENEEQTTLFDDLGFTKEEYTKEDLRELEEEWRYARLKDERYFKDNPKFIDQQGYFTVELLYKLKEHYKALHPNTKLECQ